MPLISVEEVLPNVRLGLWRIEESVNTFFSLYPDLEVLKGEIDGYGSVQRRLEVLAVRALLYCMTASSVELYHDKSGKPFLSNGVNICISHTHGCAAVIMTPSNMVSVDVEYISERVGRVAQRLLRTDENAVSLVEKLLHWCTKETLYKLYSEDSLSLSEMQLLSIDGNEHNGIITARNIRRNATVNVHYRLFDGFALTYVAL